MTVGSRQSRCGILGGRPISSNGLLHDANDDDDVCLLLNNAVTNESIAMKFGSYRDGIRPELTYILFL